MTFAQLNQKLGGGLQVAEWSQHANGSGWVHKSAMVEATAYIGEEAVIWGNARVSDNARVSGNAQVSGDAWEKSPLFILGSKHSLTNAKKGHIAIGCECRPFKWWLKEGERFAIVNGYTPHEIEEYRAYVELFVKVGK